MAAVRLLQITDTHLMGDPAAAMRGVVTLESLRRVLHATRARIEDADALLLTGDVVHDDADGYAWIRAELGALRKPVLCIPGNHDDPELMRAGLAGEPFRHCGHHDFGVWRIVMLDSTVPGDAAGEVSAAELARLEATLGEGCPPHALIVLHHQPVPVGSPGLDSVGLRNGPALLDVLARSTTARALLCGHVHQESERRAGALPAFSTPSTCVQFMPGSAGFAFDTRGPGCRSLELQDDGGVVTRVLWAD